MQRADLPLDLRRRFLTGRPCLDLVHTGGEGELARREIMRTPEEVGRWLGLILELPEPVPAGAADVAAVGPLRTALTRIAYGLAAGRTPEAAGVETLNAHAAVPPLVPRLGPAGVSWVAPTVPAALSALARDGIDLFSGPLADRIRVCAAEDCGLLFVDGSRPGTRRWCSMQRCGNLDKVRRHRDQA